MKATTRKNACILALAITASANAPVGLADSYTGTLGASNASMDVYGLTCPIGTASVRATVKNVDGPSGGVGADFISVQVINPAGVARNANSLEPVAASTGIFGKAGHYLVTVHKAASAVVEPYTINMDCFTATPAPIPGIQSALVQNQ